jgi:hypothetical protein
MEKWEAGHLQEIVYVYVYVCMYVVHLKHVARTELKLSTSKDLCWTKLKLSSSNSMAVTVQLCRPTVVVKVTRRLLLLSTLGCAENV